MRILFRRERRGFTLVELLVTIAVFGLVFGGLIASIQFTMKLISISKAKTTALSLANERLEYIRSLAYDGIGTVSGIPGGPIPQNSTTTLNGITFHERVLIRYVDSPDDGTGASDINGILADYKEVKVEYSWPSATGTSTIFLLTNIVPKGIETTAGGGTLTVNVFDAGVQPIQGASVHVYNDTTTSTIDVTQFTNADGIVMFSGAPAAANYEITVTKAGYSTDQTYEATTTNPNPVTPHVAVIESTVSTMNFQIDELSNLRVRTIEPVTYGTWSDSFDDMSKIGSMADTVLASGNVELAGGAGAYVPLGTVYATGTTPSPTIGWHHAEWSASLPVATSLTVRVYAVDAGGGYTIIPDSALPGNSAGFTTSPLSLTSVDAGAYPTLALVAELTSSDVNVTPALHSWSITHVASENVLSGIGFSFIGNKIIGTDLAAMPIYKYSQSHTTDGSGEIALSNLEWDSYTLELTSGMYDIKEACADIPYVLNPDVNETLTLTLVPSVSDTMRVSVIDTNNNPVYGASVELSRPGLSETEITSTCGQVFFNSGLSAASDYEVEVQKSGYVTQTVTPIEIDGDEILKIVLIAS